MSNEYSKRIRETARKLCSDAGYNPDEIVQGGLNRADQYLSKAVKILQKDYLMQEKLINRLVEALAFYADKGTYGISEDGSETELSGGELLIPQIDFDDFGTKPELR